MIRFHFSIRVAFLILLQCTFLHSLLSQVIYNHKIDSVLNLVSAQSISRMNKELSGDTIVTIGGIPQILYSRFYLSPGNILAAQYIYSKFQSFCLSPKYMVNDSTNTNVYAVKTGSKYPNRKFIIGAHYDDVINPYPGLFDTIHGADDNASGICAVLEAARLLANMNLDYTVVFVAFDNEEEPSPCLNGSHAFADSCFAHGDSIIGMLNLDMIGWDGNYDNKFAILSDTNSYIMNKVLYNCIPAYSLGLNYFEIYTESWDDHYFRNNGYRAITMTEEARYSFNPYYHTVGDSFDKFYVPYFQKMVKAGIAVVLTYALNLHTDIYHLPLASTYSTSPRKAQLFLALPNKTGTGANSPRLYYKLNNGSFNYLHPDSVYDLKYNFTIPGAPAGSKVTYYFAAQDTSGSFMSTLPAGGSGINPPGTTPPSELYTYYIYTSMTQCSQDLPKSIPDLQIFTDTIRINQSGRIKNVKVNLNLNHNNDGDLFVALVASQKSATLTQYNGSGGQNFINTTFDDSASLSITQGTPPYTGSFKPQTPLSSFISGQLAGNWILKIFDKTAGNTGTLVSWCLEITYENNSIGIIRNETNVINSFRLSQNYPNPFNPVTGIKFDIPKTSLVSLKVYDISGREIETLVNENLQTGSYETKWDGSMYSSGVYFYKLIGDGFTDTKRMVLIK